MTFVNKQKQRKGLSRLWHAAGYSVHGLKAGWTEAAFRLEAVVALVLTPVAFWIARNWAEVALLLGSLVLVLVIELLNSAIETVVDRVGPEWHLLSKKAKDLGSAATLLAMLLSGGIWLAALYHALLG
ncbi:MAG: Diacylglycerol kinase [Paracidovorax wautersii]|uniref:Diacylglycerol kinase n=1 Tax=Paracidovorax wautersii TaxID=1177982 RepID=A0A7V8FQT2_9BURK|nr:MAG: Diacylglycerol kinase [Paracidovorax wautersii]